MCRKKVEMLTLQKLTDRAVKYGIKRVGKSEIFECANALSMVATWKKVSEESMNELYA